MTGSTSPILLVALLTTAATLVIWVVWMRRSRRRGASAWGGDEFPVVVAEMPRVDLLEFPYEVSLILNPDAPTGLADAPIARVSSPLSQSGITAFARIDVPRRASRYAYFTTLDLGIHSGVLQARVRMFDVDASAPGRQPRGFPGDEDLFVYRSEIAVAAMPPAPGVQTSTPPAAPPSPPPTSPPTAPPSAPPPAPPA